MTGLPPLPDLSWRAVLDAARQDDGATQRVGDLIRLCETVIVRARLSCFNSMGSPRRDARALVFESLAIRDHSDRYLDARVTPIERALILDRLEQRVAGPTPVPYLTGEAFLAGLRFVVRPGVFVPRSAIGQLLDELLQSVDWPATPRVLELGCGTGAIGIAIATRVPTAAVDLVDVDELAVEVARANVTRHRLRDRVAVLHGDMFAPVDPRARYDVIVANLPYVPEHGRETSSAETLAEPPGAIFRPGDGLDLVRVALAESPLHLADAGTLWLEVGVPNEPAVRELLGDRGEWSTRGGHPTGLVRLTRDDLKA